ncbi:MAG: AMP-binding protein [Deltaproteobacteria bacterium]|nr:AMP-binding protein [Deltaproteobacteria bacterium]
MQGYWREDVATAAAFDGPWFRTGDVVTIDACGHVRIVGRSSTDIIKSGGFKLSAREVEDVLREHAWVADIAVFAVADATWGEHVTAAIVPAPGCPALAELHTVLTAFARAHLADYKCPRQWLLLDELPRNGMGKLEKSALRRRVERDSPDDVDLRAIQTR